MTRIETVENMVKTILSDESKVLGTDEYNTLIAKSETKEERDFYTAIYNYLLKKAMKDLTKGNIYKTFFLFGLPLGRVDCADG